MTVETPSYTVIFETAGSEENSFLPVLLDGLCQAHNEVAVVYLQDGVLQALQPLGSGDVRKGLRTYVDRFSLEVRGIEAGQVAQHTVVDMAEIVALSFQRGARLIWH